MRNWIHAFRFIYMRKEIQGLVHAYALKQVHEYI